MKVKDIASDSSDVHRLSEQKIELEPGEVYQHEWDLDPDEYEAVAALIETLKGEATVEFQGPPGPDESKLTQKGKRVWLYAGKLAKGVKRVAVRIKSATAATLRVTVAFVKKEALAGWGRVSCKACKALLKFAINAVLASAGIAALDIDLPLKEYLPIDSAVTQLGNVIHTAMQSVPAGLTEFLKALGPKFFVALKGALEVFNWVTGTVDRVLDAGCRVVGCCAEQASD